MSAACAAVFVAMLAGCRSADVDIGVPSGTTFAADAFSPAVEKGELPGAISVFYDNGRVETACIGYSDFET